MHTIQFVVAVPFGRGVVVAGAAAAEAAQEGAGRDAADFEFVPDLVHGARHLAKVGDGVAEVISLLVFRYLFRCSHMGSLPCAVGAVNFVHCKP